MADGSLSSRVYDEILGRILSGKMRPGELFNRRQIAAELGVSVAPVLEAMLELETEGLIQTMPRRGTRIRLPSLADAWGHTVLREAIECQAARLYCGEKVRRHHTRLHRLASELDAMTDRLADADSVAKIRSEIRFHHYLVSLAECEPLTLEFERVMKLGLLHIAIRMERDLGRATSHAELLQALAVADPDAACAAIRAHLGGVQRPEVNPTNGDRHNEIPVTPSWITGGA